MDLYNYPKAALAAIEASTMMHLGRLAGSVAGAATQINEELRVVIDSIEGPSGLAAIAD